MMLQETKLKEKEEKEEKWQQITPRGCKMFVASSKSPGRRSGVAILLNKRTAPLVIQDQIVKDTQGRFIAVPLRTLNKGEKLWVISIYAPAYTQEKETFWEKLLPSYMKVVKARCSNRDKIQIGIDANIAIHPEMDIDWELVGEEVRERNYSRKSKEAELLKDWMEEDDMMDSWRETHRGSKEFTWGGRRDTLDLEAEADEDEKKLTAGRRIDYILNSANMKMNILETKIIHPIFVNWQTDHSVIETRVAGFRTMRTPKKTYQRPLYKMQKWSETKATQVVDGMDDWQIAGRTPAKQMEDLVSQVQMRMEGCARETR